MRVLIKGAGDLASGIACRLHAAGFSVMMTEIAQPTTIRKTVAFSQAVYDKTTCVEGVEGVLVDSIEEMEAALQQRKIPVRIDPQLADKEIYHADVLVDAVLAKHNTGTTIQDAALVIGVGPGFTAGVDCHAVIESKRGHFLGRVITEGTSKAIRSSVWCAPLQRASSIRRHRSATLSKQVRRWLTAIRRQSMRRWTAWFAACFRRDCRYIPT